MANIINPNKGSALETETWLSLKECAATAQCTHETVKRAIKREALIGRKAGTGHNASYEISKSSFGEWLANRDKPKSKNAPTMEPTEILLTAAPPVESFNLGVTSATLDSNVSHPKLTKAARRKLKADRKKEIPVAARRLRRWKNFMRHASQEQVLAMIKWLSGRLAPTRKLQSKILQKADIEKPKYRSRSPKKKRTVDATQPQNK